MDVDLAQAMSQFLDIMRNVGLEEAQAGIKIAGRRLDKLKEHYKGFPGGSVVKNLLAIPGDTVRSLIQEDPNCLGATKPKHHNY